MLPHLLTVAFPFGIVSASQNGGSHAVVPMYDGRIVGGDPTFIEEYPFQASMLLLSFHRCGAVIIDKDYILTAAHCTDG